MRSLDPNTSHAELKPAIVNVKHLATVGSILWLAGLGYFGIRALLGAAVDPIHVWICLAGLAFGAVGFWWAHKRHMIDDDGMAALPETIDSPTGENE